jgi:hypothetical protein
MAIAVRDIKAADFIDKVPVSHQRLAAGNLSACFHNSSLFFLVFVIYSV